MNEQDKLKGAVRFCGECPTCRMTRNAKKKSLRYFLGRMIQRVCPCCMAANRKVGKNLQKSRNL